MRCVPGRIGWCLAGAALAATVTTAQHRVDVLEPIAGLPAHVFARFQQPATMVVSSTGDYFVLDRRAHTVFRVDPSGRAVTPLLGIGHEPGRVLRPMAMALSDDDILAVLDAPNSFQRLQYFATNGMRVGGFYLPILGTHSLVIGDQVVAGAGAMAFSGRTFWFNAPAWGALMSELDTAGVVLRHVGELRTTGHESHKALHEALNTGAPVVDPTGGMFFVFQTGRPILRKYDADGRLLFERHIEGPELDPIIARLPDRWATPDDGSRPLPAPTVRAAAADRLGQLWVVLQTGHVYLYDATGEKIRTLVFGGPVREPTSSLFFTRAGRVLAGPSGYEFDATSDSRP
jgi:hypothetical protein